MNAANHSLEILYCPKCKVGMDAALSHRQACPRCGAKRRKVRGTERWSNAEELVAIPVGENLRTRQFALAE
jgi:transcription initiation factor IIE alpha subunit